MNRSTRKKTEIWLLILILALSLTLVFTIFYAELSVCFFNGAINKVWSFINSVFFQTVVMIIGIWLVYISIKREIKIKKRLDINEKMVTYKADINTSYYAIATLSMDTTTGKAQKVSEIISTFYNRFDSFYIFFESWQNLYSSSLIYQGKHLFIFFSKYLDKLREYEHKILFPHKSTSNSLKNEIEEYSIIFANSLDDFFFNLQQKNTFLLLGKKGKARQEIENINSGDLLPYYYG